MSQDAEWCVVRVNGHWQQIRFHDYADVYAIPGLYERLFYDILKCQSPATVRRLLEAELRRSGTPPGDLRVLDLGAGNGMVGEELAHMGVEAIVGVDIYQEAADALERDRPGIYTDYFVGDVARLVNQQREQLASFAFNCLVCVAALGFGDIPPTAFAEAYNLVEPQGWIAFNIKEDFLNGPDSSGFARLIRGMIDEGVFSVEAEKRYRHRMATNGDPLFYVAIVGVKCQDVGDHLLD